MKMDSLRIGRVIEAVVVFSCLSCAATESAVDRVSAEEDDGSETDDETVLDGDLDGVTDGIDASGPDTEESAASDTGEGGGEENGSMGPGTSNEYVPDDTNSNGVGVNDDGWLQLDVSTEFIRNELWVANSGEGTVSRLDADQVVEIGRYRVGMGDDRADPSRTSVDLVGDVFVGNRASSPVQGATSSVTKIASEMSRCVDRNGNGKIDTSSGPDDMLAPVRRHRRGSGGPVYRRVCGLEPGVFPDGSGSPGDRMGVHWAAGGGLDRRGGRGF